MCPCLLRWPQCCFPCCSAKGKDGWRPNSGHTWVKCETGMIPENPVPAGMDSDGLPIYVGRAEHEGAVLPAKILANGRRACVSWDGQELTKSHFEVLCGPLVKWTIARGGKVPSKAIPVGNNPDGELLYFGWAFHEGSMTPGKVHRSHGVLYIPFGGEEYSKTDYEVMVYPH